MTWLKFSKIHMIWFTGKFKLSFRSFSSQSTIIMLLFSRTGLARQTFWPSTIRVQRSLNSHGKWPYGGRKQNLFWWLRPHWYKNISHSNSTCWSICSMVTSIMWAKSVTKERFEIDFIKNCSESEIFVFIMSIVIPWTFIYVEISGFEVKKSHLERCF